MAANSHAKTGCNRNFDITAGGDCTFQTGSQVLGHLPGLLFFLYQQQHTELFSSQTGTQVIAAKADLVGIRNRLQHHVPAMMTPGIIDVLEAEVSQFFGAMNIRAD
nr:hypothetical protein [Thiolapillus sp.]